MIVKHFYKSIKGWFDFEDIYNFAVFFSHHNISSNFIEIGSFKGKSASYMGVEIIKSGKPINFYCVDTFISTDDGLSFRKNFDKNISLVSEVIKPLEMTSEKASKLFSNNIFDFIFIDADHSFDGVYNDLCRWYPKLKNNGIIAGHDYDFPQCKRAVDMFFGKLSMEVESIGKSWMVKRYLYTDV